ncbi:MAG: DNA-binding domain-containing protein, partial [Methylocystis sp.]|nr:DNA-binding domain-containing protein [Methylocystis sp.]
MKLAEFQALFQSRILGDEGGEEALLSRIAPSPRGATTAARFDVYRDGYRARLKSFIVEDHPGLGALLGEEAFEALMEDYVASAPPRHRNARYFTTGLPDFMSADPRWRDNARAISMA